MFFQSLKSCYELCKNTFQSLHITVTLMLYMNEKNIAKFYIFHSFFSLGLCCSLDPLWLVSGLTRAVGQGLWPRCGSYPALKSILEGHIVKCTSPNKLQLCRSTGFGFHRQTRYRVELWSGKTWMYCTNRYTKATIRQEVRQIQHAWCKHSIREILF